VQDPNIPSQNNGSTCIVFIVEDKHVHVGYVGDSRAIVIERQNDNPDDTKNATIATVMGIATWAPETSVWKMPVERDCISSYAEARIDESDGYVWSGDMGLTMARALGDVDMAQAGVIPTPFMATYPCYPSDQDDPSSYRMVVMATDGVWSILSNAKVAELVLNEHDNEWKAAKVVVNEAYYAWPRDRFHDVHNDDITCLVFKL